ncbi:hypothetical protein [Thermoflavimicrobium daqui]|jgi:hypothetical protein|nr:hypothetical protein [Thermoflavimicrobium daqui]
MIKAFLLALSLSFSIKGLQILVRKKQTKKVKKSSQLDDKDDAT